VNDWVEFIKLFTSPTTNNNDLWKVNETPLINIHLSMKKKDKKKKEKKSKKEGEEAE
jgi:hypothetical protein